MWTRWSRFLLVAGCHIPTRQTRYLSAAMSISSPRVLERPVCWRRWFEVYIDRSMANLRRVSSEVSSFWVFLCVSAGKGEVYRSLLYTSAVLILFLPESVSFAKMFRVVCVRFRRSYWYCINLEFALLFWIMVYPSFRHHVTFGICLPKRVSCSSTLVFFWYSVRLMRRSFDFSEKCSRPAFC